MITVFYDGKCGICRREIQHYMNIAPEGIFNWQDITESHHELERAGFTLVEGLKYLHAKDTNDHFHIGIDAFLLIWQQLPRWKHLAKIVKLPLIYHGMVLLYKAFANWRFKRLTYCQHN